MRRSFLCKSVGALCLPVLASVVSHSAPVDLRLIDAVKNRDVPAVRELLKQRADVNATQGDGATALHWAAHRDDLTIADLLLRAGARATASNDLGVTPLHLACTNRSASMVDRLLASGANPRAAMLNGETVLMTCARGGSGAAVKALLSRGADVNAKEHEHQQTALMWAVSQHHPEVVRLLLAAGADVRARSLTYAQTVVGEETQRAGREELNYTVLRGGATALLFAARVGDVESADLLLKAGADANEAQPDGVSALVLAAHSGNGSVVALLLERGADPNAFDSGYSALHAAILRSDVALVKTLLVRGADANARIAKGTPLRRDTTDWNLPATLIGSTPYLLAARFLEPEILTALAAGGADRTLTMPDGATALMLATGMGSRTSASRRGIAVIDFGKVEPESRVRETVDTVVTLGADPNMTNQAGDTSLHVAAARGYDTVIERLVAHGARTDVANKRGLTPLASANRPSTVALLKKLGAK